MGDYDMTIFYRTGNSNVVADHLSRYPPESGEADPELDENEVACIMVLRENGEQSDQQRKHAEAMLHRNCKIPGCKICALAKMQAERTKGEWQPRRKLVFNSKVSTDVLGPVQKSYFDAQFAQVSKDEATGWRECTPMRKKDAAANEKAVSSWEKNNGAAEEGGENPKQTTWRSDSGVVLGNRKCEVVEPYAHRKNGAAERAIRSTSEETRVVVQTAKFDLADFPFARERGYGGFWDFAARWGCCLSNFCGFKGGASPRARRDLPPTEKKFFDFGQPVAFKLPKERVRKRLRFEVDARGNTEERRRGAFLGWTNYTGLGGSYIVAVASKSAPPKLVFTTNIRAIA
jgi:hypothetical protein